MTVEQLRKNMLMIESVIDEYCELAKNKASIASWLEFMTSADFLQVYTKNDFTTMLNKVIENNIENYLPPDEFLDLLYVVYGLVDINIDDIEDSEFVYFYGLEAIIEIVIQYRKPRKLSPLNISVYKSFESYRILWAVSRLDEKWNLRVLKIYVEILQGYKSHNIHSHIDESMLDIHTSETLPKHYQMLSLLLYYFTNAKLPPEAYYRCWKVLELYNIKDTLYKSKYINLRAIIVEKSPRLESIGSYFYDNLNTTFRSYNELAKERTIVNFMDEKMAVDKLFAHPEFYSAMHDEIFIDEVLIALWLDFDKYIQTDYFLERLLIICNESPDIPQKEKVLTKIKSVSLHNEIQERVDEDNKSPIIGNCANVYNRAFFRYYLYSAFNLSKTSSGDIDLWYMLHAYLPYCKDWVHRFLESDGQSAKVQVQEGELEIIFKKYYIEYYLNGNQIYDRIIHCSQFFNIDDDNLFWRLLPCAFANEKEGYTVFTEIKKRLERLDVLLHNSIVIVADCLARHVCQSFDKEFYNTEVISFNEDNTTLYVCIANFINGKIDILKKQINKGLIDFESDQIHGLDKPQAITLSKRTVETLVNTNSQINVRDDQLPDCVYIRQVNEECSEITENIDCDILNKLFKLYIENEVYRLEFYYKNTERSVVFENDITYACFVYDHKKYVRYGLLSLPELYHNKSKNDSHHEPLFYGKIEHYVSHRHSDMISKNISKIIQNVADSSDKYLEDSRMWSRKVYKKEDFYYDMITIGNFSFNRMKQGWNDELYLPYEPLQSFGKLNDGTKISFENSKEAINEYFNNNLKKLILKWKVSELDPIVNQELITYEAYIILLQENGKYMMIIGSDYMAKMYYLKTPVSHRKNITFLNNPQYNTVVHSDTKRIRDYLSLVLLNIDSPFAFLRLFELYDFGDRKDVFEDALCVNGAFSYKECKNNYYTI